MYKILKIEPKGSRMLVFLDNNISFLLYKGEIRKFNIVEEAFIEEAVYLEIIELLYKRARERALYLLDDSYKTEQQIQDKLKAGCYPEEIIHKVIEYLKEYGLIDDLRYCKLYIDYKSSSKSKKKLIQDLYMKGVQKNIIEQAFLESDYVEEDSLGKVIEKRISRYDLENPKDIQKLYRYLIGKGYQYGDVKIALSKYIENIY